MSIKKTLGGERLGSGKKMQVELRNFERSTHDLGYLWRSTMSMGTLVPFMSLVGLPGDTFDIELYLDGKTHPTVGPLFGSAKYQLDVFVAPIRLYNSLLHNNALNIGLNMAQVKLPQIELEAKDVDVDPTTTPDIDNSQINPSCLLSYLGIRGVGIPNGTDIRRQFNACSILSYWDIYKNYYSHKPEEIGAVIHTPYVVPTETIDLVTADGNTIPTGGTVNPTYLTEGSNIQVEYTGTAPVANQIIFATNEAGEVPLNEFATLVSDVAGVQTYSFNYAQWTYLTVLSWRYITDTDQGFIQPTVATFPLSNIDELRTLILAYNSTTTPFVIGTDITIEPYIWLTEKVGTTWNIQQSQEGLAVKTYQSDLFNNWLNEETIDGTNGISQITSIDTSGGSFTIDTLNLSKKVYNMLNDIAVAGGTYDDWMEAVYAHQAFRRAETPMYMGGLSQELVFQEVISNSESGDQPLGTLGGRGVLSNKRKGGKVYIKIDEPSYIIGIVSITPRIDYSQGNDWDTTLQTLDDLHKPHLDEIGFQDLQQELMAWWTTEHNGTEWVQKSVGKQPAWINYMTAVNKTKGNFAIADNEMFMTFNRRYENDGSGEIADLTTYIDPVKYNYLFADTALDAQNYWTQIAVDITARRKMSAKIMPNM